MQAAPAEKQTVEWASAGTVGNWAGAPRPVLRTGPGRAATMPEMAAVKFVSTEMPSRLGGRGIPKACDLALAQLLLKLAVIAPH
jgi:hypothetical protein